MFDSGLIHKSHEIILHSFDDTFCMFGWFSLQLHVRMEFCAFVHRLVNHLDTVPWALWTQTDLRPVAIISEKFNEKVMLELEFCGKRKLEH